MVEKKVKKDQKKTIKKMPPKRAPKVKSDKTKQVKSSSVTKPKTKKTADDSNADIGIVIVDDDIHIDQEKINEERRAYLEEARSQEAYD